MKEHQTLIVLDLGGQYTKLIARRIREANVYCEVLPFNTKISEIRKKNPVGIILSGSPQAVGKKNSYGIDKRLFDMRIPILGICYGMQLISHEFGGKLKKAKKAEYGRKNIRFNTSHSLFRGIKRTSTCFMSHTYHVIVPPADFKVIAQTDTCPIAAVANDKIRIYGVQFHPEVIHTPEGNGILKNFLYSICCFKGDWVMKDYAKETIEEIRRTVGKKSVLCAVSGGVDSTVTAYILKLAIGDRLKCIFVNHGLLRLREEQRILETFKKKLGLNVDYVDAEEEFLGALKGKTDPEEKRKIIGEKFIRVFEQQAKKFKGIEFLAQGTIYPDVIESGTQHAAMIKSHHNVGGLPEKMGFKSVIEPLRPLFKDEVRMLGKTLGIPKSSLNRQPFPGPGLAVRIIGDIDKKKTDILKKADHIFTTELEKTKIENAWQYFAVLTGLRSVGVMGDERTYGYTIALRAVSSVDGMTADWVRLPHDLLERVSTRIVNEVRDVSRVVYDITSKPPSTIEWE